ncbi:MAG: SPASM domain-containing protein [Magnetococcus sp. YQC-3]
MRFDVAKKIIDEVSSDAFTEKYQMVKFVVGENGDSFINKNAIDILRYIKFKNSLYNIFCVSNFQNLTPEKSEIIVREKLVNSICLNIDGSTKSNYYAVKKLDLGLVMDINLRAFLNFRDEYSVDIPIHVSILSMNNYIQAVNKKFGRLPIQLTDPDAVHMEDDTEATREMLRPWIRPGDVVSRVNPMFWAERKAVDTSILDYSKYRCPLLKRVRNEVFVAPDGTWYACCFDSNNELELGNVYETSIDEVACSAKRKELIRLLEEQKFAEVGYPCNTVNCCWA